MKVKKNAEIICYMPMSLMSLVICFRVFGSRYLAIGYFWLFAYPVFPLKEKFPNWFTCSSVKNFFYSVTLESHSFSINARFSCTYASISRGKKYSENSAYILNEWSLCIKSKFAVCDGCHYLLHFIVNGQRDM